MSRLEEIRKNIKILKEYREYLMTYKKKQKNNTKKLIKKK